VPTLLSALPRFLFFVFSNDAAPTELYTLSLHDALPISPALLQSLGAVSVSMEIPARERAAPLCKNSRREDWFDVLEVCFSMAERSEEHTSELQSPYDLVCRLLLEKKKKTKDNYTQSNIE